MSKKKALGSTLPAEILLNIFDHLKGSSQDWLIKGYFCQCRLVCKSWNQSATKALFPQKHRLSYQDKMIKFYNHVSTNPSLAQKIKHLKLNLYGEEDLDMAFLKRFFSLVLTPALVSLTGSLDSNVIALLADIFQQNPETCSKMEQLPTLHNNGFDKNILKLLSCCEDSLTTINIRIKPAAVSLEPLVAVLPKFIKLKELTLSMECDNDVIGMENVLQGCPRLTSLFIYLSDGLTHGSSMDENELQDFLEGQVKKTDHEVQIFSSINRPDVLQYLSFKYSNIVYLRSNDFQLEFGDAERALNAIQHIGKIDLKEWDLHYMEVIELFITTMKNRFNKLHLQFYNDRRLSACASKDVESDTSSFSLNFSRETRQDMVEEILLSLNTVTEYHLVQWSVDDVFLHAFPKIPGRQELDFYTSLRLYPDIETLILESDDIPHRDQYPCDLTLESLRDASIVKSRRLSSTFLQFVERLAPNLQYLTLKNCRVKSTEQPNSQHICMTNTHFTKLSIISEFRSITSKDNYYDCVDTFWEKKLSPKADALLLQIKMVSSKDFPVQHFLLKPGRTASCAPISQDYYNKNVNTWLVMIIECKFLELLQFDLGALALNMTFGANGELMKAISKTIVY